MQMGTVRGETFNFRLYAGDVDEPAHAHVRTDKGEVVVDVYGPEAHAARNSRQC